MSKSKNTSDLDMEMVQGIYSLAKLGNSHKKFLQSLSKDDLVSSIDTLLHQKASLIEFSSNVKVQSDNDFADTKKVLLSRLETIAKKTSAYIYLEAGMKNSVKRVNDYKSIEDIKNTLNSVVDDFDVWSELYYSLSNELHCLIEDLRENKVN